MTHNRIPYIVIALLTISAFINIRGQIERVGAFQNTTFLCNQKDAMTCSEPGSWLAVFPNEQYSDMCDRVAIPMCRSDHTKNIFTSYACVNGKRQTISTYICGKDNIWMTNVAGATIVTYP